jgi:hypothetical protein
VNAYDNKCVIIEAIVENYNKNKKLILFCIYFSLQSLTVEFTGEGWTCAKIKLKCICARACVRARVCLFRQKYNV